jgi:hypothetical protein
VKFSNYFKGNKEYKRLIALKIEAISTSETTRLSIPKTGSFILEAART